MESGAAGLGASWAVARPKPRTPNKTHTSPTENHNGHIIWIKLRDRSERDALIQHLAIHKIMGTFHYIPLHSAPAGPKYGSFVGNDKYTTRESERLLRLPIYHGFTEVDRVVSCIERFFDSAQ